MKKCHAKNFFLLNNCLSNLAILYGLCILFVFLILIFFIDCGVVVGGWYLISIANCPFFSSPEPKAHKVSL